MTDPQEALPPLPEPYSVASTFNCTRCGRPWKSNLNPAVMAGGIGMWTPPRYACECGGDTFAGTVGYDSPSPAIYTADQLRAYAEAAVARERERAARVVESMSAYTWVDGHDQWNNPCHAKVVTTPSHCAAAIRKGP